MGASEVQFTYPSLETLLWGAVGVLLWSGRTVWGGGRGTECGTTAGGDPFLSSHEAIQGGIVLILRLALGSTAVLPVPGRGWSMKGGVVATSGVTGVDSECSLKTKVN